MADINQRVKGTDIFVFDYDNATGLIRYSRPFFHNEAQTLVTDVNRAIESYGNIQGLHGGLKVNDRRELFNISTLEGIVINRVLMERSNNQQWLPIINEAYQLAEHDVPPLCWCYDLEAVNEKREDYEGDEVIYMGCGVLLVNDEGPDKEIAQALIEDANRHGYSLPVLLSFKSLDIRRGGGKYGIVPKLVPEEVIFGTKAEKILFYAGFGIGDYPGVHSVYCDRAGFCIGGVNLADSHESTRAGRVSVKSSLQQLIDGAFELANAPIRNGIDSLLKSLKII